MKRRRRKKPSKKDKQRAREAYSAFMRANLALPDKAWKTDASTECRTIQIWRRQYAYNHQHMRVLTTGKGVRFQIIN